MGFASNIRKKRQQVIVDYQGIFMNIKKKIKLKEYAALISKVKRYVRH